MYSPVHDAVISVQSDSSQLDIINPSMSSITRYFTTEVTMYIIVSNAIEFLCLARTES